MGLVDSLVVGFSLVAVAGACEVSKVGKIEGSTLGLVLLAGKVGAEVSIGVDWKLERSVGLSDAVSIGLGDGRIVGVLLAIIVGGCDTSLVGRLEEAVLGSTLATMVGTEVSMGVGWELERTDGVSDAVLIGLDDGLEVGLSLASTGPCDIKEVGVSEDPLANMVGAEV